MMTDPNVLTIISSVLLAIISAAVTLFLGRKKATTEIQDVVNRGFEALIKVLEGQAAMREAKIDDLQRTLNQCNNRNAKMIIMLATAGIPIPPDA